MPTISERLKEAGTELHAKAEHAGFTRELFKGRRPIGDYVALLGQMLLIHEALERRLAETSHPAVKAVFADDQRKADLIEQDLIDLDSPPHAEPLPATGAFVARIEQADPVWLLGVHYVLEGSTNGNRFVAGAIRKAYGLEGERATRYLDPYADAQRVRWALFKKSLDAAPLSPDEQETLIEADLATFQAIIDIHEQLDGATVAG